MLQARLIFDLPVVAGYKAFGGNFPQRGTALLTLLRRVAAAGAEGTAFGHPQGRGNVAFQDDAVLVPRGLRIRHGNGGDQGFGIGVNGGIDDIPGGTDLHHAICAWMDTSRAETGSSQTMKRGLTARARAMPMRWRWPPENSWA